MLGAMGARPVRVCRIGAFLLALTLLHGASIGAAQAQNAAETAFWNRVRDSSNASELRAYLEAYPNGAFADTARARLRQIEPTTLRPQMPSGPAPGGHALTDAAVVREVQERLYNLNYDISVLNGQLTEETRSAIRGWQKSAKREPTGELTEDELIELRNTRIPTTWGALAYAARGASAVVWNRPSRQEAVSAALTDCHARAGRDECKVMTAIDASCGALGFYMGTVRRTTYWGAYAIVRPTLGQAMDLALTTCREQAKRPEACGVRLTFCADGSHKQ
jgi:peptidoglycan hydrolase-like protein with peptidoglycan-binding domain